MEHEHSIGGGEQRLTDKQLIYYHIIKALRKERPIDHATVKAIASQLHDGPGSTLYALGMSGTVIAGLGSGLDRRRQAETSVEREPWRDALEEYLDSRDDPGPIKGWRDMWPSQPTHEGPDP
jgi:hypothetical protein